MNTPMAQDPSTVEAGKLFVGGLSWETTKEKLQDYFSQFGAVTDSVIMIDSTTGKPRGFGFVTFADPASANKALTSGPHILDSKTVDPKPATKKQNLPLQRPSPATSALVKKIFVGGIALGTTDEDVRSYFSTIGNVTEVDLKYDKNTGNMRGFGFVEFDDEQTVEELVKNQYHTIKGKTVEVKKAEPRGAGGSTTGFGRGGFQQQQFNGAGYGAGRGGFVQGSYGYGYPGYDQQQQYAGYAASYQASYPQQSYGGGASYGTRGDYTYGSGQHSAGGSQMAAAYTQGVDQTSSYQSSARGSYGGSTEGYPTQGSYGYDPSSYQQQQQQQYDTSQGASYGRGAQQRGNYSQYGARQM